MSTQAILSRDAAKTASGRRDLHRNARSRRIGRLAVAALLLYMGATALHRALNKAFWYDEICTIAVSEQRNWAEMWRALQAGVDGQPPGFYVVERAALFVIANKHVAYRLPSILGALCVSAALFFFVGRRAGNIAGLIAAITPMTGPLWDTFALEGRPYTMITACGALSICLWRKAERPIPAALLALILAGASCLHYFGVLLAVPIGLTEAVRFWRTRQFRMGVWLALICGPLPLLAWRPLLVSLKAIYGTSFWAQPKLAGIPATYGHLLGIEDIWGAGIALALIIGTALALSRGLSRRTLQDVETWPEEYVLLLGFLALPAIGFAVATLTHGGLSPRYVIPSAIGIWASLALLASRAGQKVSCLLLLLLLTVLTCKEGLAWMKPQKASRPLDQLRWASATVHDFRGWADLPLVISDGKTYLPMAYYAYEQNLRPIVAIVDPARAVEYIGTDSVDRGLSLLARYIPLDVREFSQFASEHHQFLVYSSGTAFDWLPQMLLKEGFSLRTLNFTGSTLYLVNSSSDELR
jgi:4-amino-4-deoxy-L-arabinose transferase-like glycosyltransferase